MGDAQSAQRESKKDAAAEEESGQVDDARAEQNTEDKVSARSPQILMHGLLLIIPALTHKLCGVDFWFNLAFIAVTNSFVKDFLKQSEDAVCYRNAEAGFYCCQGSAAAAKTSINLMVKGEKVLVSFDRSASSTLSYSRTLIMAFVHLKNEIFMIF